MPSFNKVILIGNMVADPELKMTPGDVPVTSFRIAVARRYIKSGEQPQADFFDVVAWRKRAEFVTRYFTRGKPILVCGTLQTRQWTDKDGNKRSTTEIVADEVSFVERKQQDDNGNNSNNYPVPPSQKAGSTAPAPYSSNYGDAPKFEELAADDDLPF